MKNTIRVLEVIAVVCSLLYTILIKEGIIWCWLFSLFASLIYLFICFKKRIYAESILQLFYVFTTVYGYLNWGEGLRQNLPTLAWQYHAAIAVSGIAMVIVSGLLLKRMSDAATPFVDSFTTIFSIFATLLMINLFPSNWIYWIIIDAVSVYLYFSRKLYLTSLLFLLYTIISVDGYLAWSSL